MNQKAILEVYNQYGKIEKIEVLKYFKLKQNNQDYIIYKPITSKTNTESFIFSAKIKENNDSIFLRPIEDKKIEELIKSIAKKHFNGEKNNG